MKRFAAFLIVFLAAAAARGDIIHLKNGATREGRIVSQTKEAVILEVTVGSATARVTLNPDDIDRIEAKLTPQEQFMAEYRERLAKVDRTNAEQVVDLAKWCMLNKRYDLAETLLTALAEKGDVQALAAHMALANMEYDRKRFDQAREYLAEVLRAHPGYADAEMLEKLMKKDEGEALERLLSDAGNAFKAGDFELALKRAEAFHDRVTPEQQKTLLAKTPLPEGLTFDAFAAECRLRQPCRFCKDGYKTCPVCNGKTGKDDETLCLNCGGAGVVICDRCGGTNADIGNVPEWEVPAVAAAIDARITRDRAVLDKALKGLKAAAIGETLVAQAHAAELLASRTAGWYDALEKVTADKPAVTTRKPALERAEVQTQFRDAAVTLADQFSKNAQDAWKKASADRTRGMLEQDSDLRAARLDVVMALYLYNRTRPDAKADYPLTVAPRVKAAEPLLADAEKAIDHNAKMLKAFDIALKAMRLNRLDAVLQVLTDLVNNADKPDLAYLSTKMKREVNGTVSEVMALSRFELGNKKSDFGDTTEYERADFVKKLIFEADARANLAHADYQEMRGYVIRGNKARVPTSQVRRCRENAEYARDWYRAVFRVPYPLSTEKRRAIDDQINYMEDIIDRCRRWYRTTTPGI